MKILLTALITFILTTFPAQSQAQDPSIYAATCLTGGSYCLDYIDVYYPDTYNLTIRLQDGDMATVVSLTQGAYSYVFDDDSGATEYSPSVIKPDFNAGEAYAGTGRWILVDFTPSNAISLDNRYSCALTTAVTALETAATNVELIVDCAASIAAAGTVTTAYANLTVVPGGSITIGDGATLTTGGGFTMMPGAGLIAGFDGGENVNVNGLFVCPSGQQVFGDYLTVDLSGAKTDGIYPEAWEIDGTADEVQINAAITAAAGAIPVRLGDTYTIAATITANVADTMLIPDNGLCTITTAADINGITFSEKRIRASNIRMIQSGASTKAAFYFIDSAATGAKNGVFDFLWNQTTLAVE
jgi:hypothetical protein